MRTTTLGRTGLQVTNNAFGCLPIQRISMEDAGNMLRRAVDAGITFFDTARAYSDSEAKIGNALADVREKIVIASKTMAKNADGLWRDLEASLDALRTGYIDVYQFHNPDFVPRPGGVDGLYDAVLDAKRQGKIRHIGISQHSLDLAEEAVRSGLYDTLQFPFNHLATEREMALMELCRTENVGFICMKALSGGLITDAAVPFSFFRQYENPVPIWGFQHMWELEQLIGLEQNPPVLDAEMIRKIEEDRKELSGTFCRGCGYCLPCPVGIPIDMANRMSQMITRSPSAKLMTQDWQAKMERIADCTQCGACHAHCPYGLKPYETLPEHLTFYRAYVAEHGGEVV